MKRIDLIVDADYSNIRLDVYLKEQTNLSRTYIQTLIKNKQVLVNNDFSSNKYLVKQDDIISLSFEYKDEEINILPKEMKLDIIYEDEDVIVVNKPKGLVVHPGAGNYDNTLVNGLLYYTNTLSDINGYIRPGIVHRIDKDTSGLLVVCKNNIAHNFIANQLQDKRCYRKYICIVDGIITNNEGTIDAPIGRDLKDRQKMCVTSKNSKNAITHFKVLDRFSNYTLLECELETGRTHQIRVHMSYIKHPLVNDAKYNKNIIDDKGQYLHAYYLSFIHPKNNNRVEFKIDIPEYIKDFVIKNGGTYFNAK